VIKPLPGSIIVSTFRQRKVFLIDVVQKSTKIKFALAGKKTMEMVARERKRILLKSVHLSWNS